MMNDGEHVIFAIQFRRIHENKWGKPRSKLEPVEKDKDWGFVGADGWGKFIDPHADEEAHQELFHSIMDGGVQGWYTMKHAVDAINTLKKANMAGQLDTTDIYTHEKMQKVRYEFRIVKVTTSKKTEILDH